MPGELEPLGLTARKRRHWLAQLHIVQSHIHNRLQCGYNVAVLCKQRHGLADGQIQYIGHTQPARLHVADRLALDFDFQHFRPVALAFAIRAAQIDIA